MEIFINQLSLHGQYQDPTEFVAAIRKFMGIFSLINQKRVNAYKNESILAYRPVILSDVFVSSLDRLSDKSLKIAFKDIVFNKNNPKDWQETRVHDNNDIYACESLCNFVDGTTLAEVTERILVQGDIARVLVNFCPSCFSGGSDIEVWKNEDTNIVALPWVEEHSALECWFPAIRPADLLKDSTRFRLTGYRNFKTCTPIYEEIKTGYFWAFDNFHCTHFEVWDTQKEHLGEADLYLNLDRDKSDPAKHGKLPF